MTEAQAAAFRLLVDARESGKLREVRKASAPHNPWSRIGDSARAHQIGNPGRRRILTGKGRGGANRKRLLIDGAQYNSINEVRRKLGVGYHTVYSWIDEGKAKYIKEETK